MEKKEKHYWIAASRGRGDETAKVKNRQQMLEIRSDRFTNTLTSVQKDNLLLIQYGKTIKF